MRSRAIRQVWQSLLLVAFGVGLSCVLLELAIRVWKRDVAFQPDPELIRSLRPNVTRKLYSFDSPQVLESQRRAAAPVFLGMDYTNNVGLRMKDDVGARSADERRILLLGDSFTEAEQVPDDQRFYHLMQDALNQAVSGVPRWRVLNAGIQNGAPSQYILQLRRYLPQFHPDVVLVFVAPNDAQDDFNFEDRYGFEFDDRGMPRRIQAATQLWLLQKWWTLRYLDVAAQRRGAEFYDLLWPHRLEQRDHPDWWLLLCSAEPAGRAWFLRKTGPFINELKRMSQTAGARFGVVLIQYMWIFPDEASADSPDPARAATGLRGECLRNGGRPYRQFMHAFLERSGIAYVDLYDALRAAKTRQPRVKLWNFYDYHFSPAGHRVVADAVVEFLERDFLDH